MRTSLGSLGRHEGLIFIPWRSARTPLSVVAMLLVAGLLYAPHVEAYEQYHPSDTGSAGDGCYQCHGWDNDLNPAWVASQEPPDNIRWRNGGFDGRAALHDMHVSQITGTCDLCHISTGDVPYTYTSGDPAGQGCRGCHGVDNGTEFNWGAGLRLHHANAGAPADQQGLFCADCHGGDPAPQPEDSVPMYYNRGDVNAKDPCNADGTEDWGASFGEPFDVPDGFGLDNDGDLLYDADDPDCAEGGVLGDVDCDGSLTPVDASVILGLFVGSVQDSDLPPPCNDPAIRLAVSDWDLSGTINPIDASVTLGIFVTSVDECDTPLGQSIPGLCPVPAAAAGQNTVASAAPSAAGLRVSRGKARRGGEMTVQVRTRTALELASSGLTLTYDSSALDVVSVASSLDGFTYRADEQAGAIRTASAGLGQSLTAGDSLISVVFRVKPDARSGRHAVSVVGDLGGPVLKGQMPARITTSTGEGFVLVVGRRR